MGLNYYSDSSKGAAGKGVGDHMEKAGHPRKNAFLPELLYKGSLVFTMLCTGLLLSCGPSEQVSDKPELVKDSLSAEDSKSPASQSTAPASQRTQRQNVKKLVKDDTVSDKIILTFDNGNSRVTVPLDPDNQEFTVNLEGSFERQQQKRDTAQKARKSRKTRKKQQKQQKKQKKVSDSLKQARLENEVNKVMKNFRRAQDLLYQNDYKSAMKYIDRTLKIAETAEAMGLKGTIFFMMDNMEAAQYWWDQAVDKDPNIRVPEIPELKEIINKNIKADTVSQ